MGRKGKQRQEARRRARQRREEQQQERPPEEEGVEAEAEAPARQERFGDAEERARGRGARKRAKREVGLLERVSRLRVSPWLIATPVVAIGVGVLAYLILSSGSSGTTGGTPSEGTPDPRVAGLPIDVSFDIEAGDDGGSTGGGSFFRPDTFTANAGDVVEFVVTNTGSVTHNIWLAGADNQYETEDDFGPINLIEPGETDRLVSKIDEPDTYLFRCQIHPLLQIGTLVLQ